MPDSLKPASLKLVLQRCYKAHEPKLRVRSVSHSATRAGDTDTASSNCTLMFLTPCRNTSAESKVLKERQRRLARMTAL